MIVLYMSEGVFRGVLVFVLYIKWLFYPQLKQLQPFPTTRAKWSFFPFESSFFNFCTSILLMSSSSRFSRFLLWFSSSPRMLGEVKLLSSPNLVFFLFTSEDEISSAKTESFWQSQISTFTLLLFPTSKLCYRNHNFNSKVSGADFC